MHSIIERASPAQASMRSEIAMTATRSTTGTRHQYSVIVTYDREHDMYNAAVPTLGFVTDGFSVEHAFEMAEEAITLWIETAVEDVIPIPVEDHPAHLRQVSV